MQQQEDGGAHLDSKKQYLRQLAASTRLAPDTPNIILFLYDDMGYGDIGAGVTNPGLIATPNLDRLAAEGVTLSDFHSPSPVCAPPRAGYLTGRLVGVLRLLRRQVKENWDWALNASSSQQLNCKLTINQIRLL